MTQQRDEQSDLASSTDTSLVGRLAQAVANTTSAADPTAWVFQANPAGDKLTIGQKLRWSIDRQWGEVQEGATVYIWDTGPSEGITATAIVQPFEPYISGISLKGALRSEIERIERGGSQDVSSLRPSRVPLQIQTVLPRHITADELRADPALANMAILHQSEVAVFPLNAAEAIALAVLVAEVIDDEQDDEQQDNDEPPTPATPDELAAWRAELTMRDPLVRHIAEHYPEWVRDTFGLRATFATTTSQRFSVHLDGRWVHNGRLNQRQGGVWVAFKLDERVWGYLREHLSAAAQLTRGRQITFNIYTEPDYRVLQNAVRLIGGLALAEAPAYISEQAHPPQPLDGPAFVLIHKRNDDEQQYGKTYTFTPNTFGDARELIDAIEAHAADGPPVYLVIYRPGPAYAFTAWACVRAFEHRVDDGDHYILTLEQHEFPRALNLKDRTAAVREQVPWLRAGLREAFNYRTIREIDAEAFATIINAAYTVQEQPMTLADAAFQVLTQADGGPMHLPRIWEQIATQNLYQTQSQTPQLSLASVMLRDDRFHNLGQNSWVLARSTPDADDDHDEPPVDLPAPPIRQPAIYAKDGTHFWRVHFSRELWPVARRQGAIAIHVPIDAPNQSAQRFQQIAVGDRVVAYVQGGTIGGIGVVTRAFDPEHPTAGFAADLFGDEFTQFVRVAWADAPDAPTDLLDALRHDSYSSLYNRVKNPHAVVELERDDYVQLLSLLQVDDAGEPKSVSRLPSVWPELAPYLRFASTLGDEAQTAAALLEAARRFDATLTGELAAEDLVVSLQQLRLLEGVDSTSYRLRTYAQGAVDGDALARLAVLALLVPLEGTADQYQLPARAIVHRLRTTDGQQPTDTFAPELGADGPALLAWYAEAGIVQVDDDMWTVAPDALAQRPGDDAATEHYNRFIAGLTDELDGQPTATDLPTIAAQAALPVVEALDQRIAELAAEILIDPAIVRRIYRSLIAGRHVVLSGPPGTGKTELAQRLPPLLWREESHEFQRLTSRLEREPVAVINEQRHGYAAEVVTATEDWSVRDVVGGIGPRLDGEGKLTYAIEHGALTRTVLKHYAETEGGRRLPTAGSPWARRDYRHEDNRRYRGVWLVIDEFTRAPVDAAFGGLLTTLSGGENAKLAVPSAAGDARQVPLPHDFRIIGTLNSFDRHFLNQMSEAMKRRFDFIDVPPPPPTAANDEQGVAAKQALARLRRSGFNQIARDDTTATYRWPDVLTVALQLDPAGTQRYHVEATDATAAAALRSFWQIFSGIRVFRQLGTAQVVAVYTNLFAGVLTSAMDWHEALDTALGDTLADQLQVLNRDAQRTITALLDHAGDQAAFAQAVDGIVQEMPAGRRAAYLHALRDDDTAKHGQSDIDPEGTATLSTAQIERVFAATEPLQLPDASIFRRRLRDLMLERGL